MDEPAVTVGQIVWPLFDLFGQIVEFDLFGQIVWPLFDLFDQWAGARCWAIAGWWATGVLHEDQAV